MDYISSTTTNTDGYANFSGYASLGLGGDGGLTAGNAAWLTDFDSTLELNLNRAGYTTTIVNSPVGDSNWNYVNGYSFTVKAAAFAGSSFGAVTVVEQHNSPSKTGVNATFPTPSDSEVTNTAVVTAKINGQSVVAIDDATVSIISGPLGSLGDRVWFDTNANGKQDSGELGISNVTVQLFGDFDDDGTIEYTATTTTNASGNYTFTALPAGVYTVSVNSATLPANYLQTYDLDGIASANTANADLTAGQNRTDLDFGYAVTANGFTIVKTADKATAAAGESVTYTYVVSNTGPVALTNVVVKDDNGTPNNTADDFNPAYVSGDGGILGTLELNENWTYSKIVIPPTTGGPSTNTAVVTATLNGNTVVALDDATVLINPAPVKFFVVDSGADDVFTYSASGTSQGNFALQAGNTDPRGIAANTDGSMLWVLDKDKNVNVYDDDGTAIGLWKADGLGKEPQGITVDGNDLWMVDSDAKKIFWYDNAALNTSGTDKPEKTFAYDAGKVGTAKGIVTDGTYLWLVNDDKSGDHVTRFTIHRNGSGTPDGLTNLTSWNLDSHNSKATGLTIDPTGASYSIWVVDDGTNQVFEYKNARDGWSSGEGYTTFNLAAGNLTPQDIADPRALIGDTSTVFTGDVDASTVDSGLNGDDLVSLNNIDLANETVWADAYSDAPTDTDLTVLASLLGDPGSLDFGSTAVADAQVAVAPADALVEVVNLATLVSNDPVWMA
jgi:hypothetical protein